MNSTLKDTILIESTFSSNLRTCIVSLSFALALKNYSKEKNIMIICNLLFLISFLLV